MTISNSRAALFAFALLTIAGAETFAQGPKPEAAPSAGDPSTLMWACYVPNSGTVYRIRTGDTKESCASQQHVMFSWNPLGLKGDKGDTGEQGVPGKDGTNGADGKDGLPGKDGANGVDGKDGLPGKDGTNGVDGKDGLPGKDGTNGVDGKDGLPGKDGEKGDVGPQGPPATIDPAGIAVAGAVNAQGMRTLVAQCPPNTRITGGGFVTKALHTPPNVGLQLPIFSINSLSGTVPNAWRVDFFQPGPSTSDVEAHAFCAKVP